MHNIIGTKAKIMAVIFFIWLLQGCYIIPDGADRTPPTVTYSIGECDDFTRTIALNEPLVSYEVDIMNQVNCFFYATAIDRESGIKSFTLELGLAVICKDSAGNDLPLVFYPDSGVPFIGSVVDDGSVLDGSAPGFAMRWIILTASEELPLGGATVKRSLQTEVCGTENTLARFSGQIIAKAINHSDLESVTTKELPILSRCTPELCDVLSCRNLPELTEDLQCCGTIKESLIPHCANNQVSAVEYVYDGRALQIIKTHCESDLVLVNPQQNGCTLSRPTRSPDDHRCNSTARRFLRGDLVEGSVICTVSPAP